MPPSTGLSEIQFPEKYNNTEMKSGQIFTATTQHFTPAVVNLKIQVKSREQPN